jgi:glycosylphosphatidylinositol transamidase (GPIT) subunit GPI8
MFTKKHVKHCYPLLKVLKKIKGSDRQIILQHLDEEACESVRNCIYNALYNSDIGNTKILRKKLMSNQKELKDLAIKKKFSKRRRNQLVQVGGFPLGAILAAAIPILSSIIGYK